MKVKCPQCSDLLVVQSPYSPDTCLAWALYSKVVFLAVFLGSFFVTLGAFLKDGIG